MLSLKGATPSPLATLGFNVPSVIVATKLGESVMGGHDGNPPASRRSHCRLGQVRHRPKLLTSILGS